MKKKIKNSHFINRELSWLDFNSRVLDEAFDKTNPILERMKFLAIFSSNLDEFFMVRVAGLKQNINKNKTSKDSSGMTSAEQLEKVEEKIRKLLKVQYNYLNDVLLPELKENGITIIKPSKAGIRENERLNKYFDDEILPVLTPIGVDPTHPFPTINNQVIEIAVKIKHPESGKILHGFVEVPSKLPNFIEIHSHSNNSQSFVMLEDLIHDNMEKLYSGYEILNTFLFRITKDRDFLLDAEQEEDFLSYIQQSLLSTRQRKIIRLEVLKGKKGDVPAWLAEKMGISEDCTYRLNGPLNLARLFELKSLIKRSDLADEQLPIMDIPVIQENQSIFDSINQWHSIPIFHPFESFDPVINYLNEAADDPNVLAIKQTLYRVSGDSPVVEALQRAAENGKQVTVIVELKARFDESNNITWAKRLEQSGAHVIYGIANLKIHCKALIVIRREARVIKRYLHLSTGNYNDITAQFYTDIGIFLDDPDICADISNLFNVMTGYSEPPEWRKIAVAPFNLRATFIRLIERETRLSTPHNPGHIIAKMNSLVDKEIIEYLYKAAYAGVKIELIVRGICCLKPGLETNNIRIISIVDRYLEHSRIYYFGNGGSPECFLSSADWMTRNLDTRIELLFPVQDPFSRELIMKFLELQLCDTSKSRYLNSEGNYIKVKDKENSIRSQHDSYKLLKKSRPRDKKKKNIIFKSIE